MKNNRLRIIFRWIKVALMLYGIIGIAVYYLQDKLLFRPEKVARETPYEFPAPFREINIPYSDSSNINIIQFACKDKPKCVVLYFHGNRKNIGWYAKYASNFTRNGCEVWMIDYPGYGKSTGALTEPLLYKFAEQLYVLALTSFKKDSIVLYGKSMGSALATYLASRKNCKRLILETPYYSITSLASHYLPVYPTERMIHFKLPTYQYLQQVIVPVTIFHGTDDGVIPISNAKKLLPLMKPGDEFITIKGGSHNDLNDYLLFHQKLDSLLK